MADFSEFAARPSQRLDGHETMSLSTGMLISLRPVLTNSNTATLIMAREKIHTTNYYNTLVEVAEDTKVSAGTKPVSKAKGKTVAEIQYDILAANPYKYTSDDVFFQVYVERNDLERSAYKLAWQQFFSKGQPCFRSSPLTKIYGFGVHADSNGRVAIYGMETEQYQKLQRDPTVKKVKALRSAGK